MGDGRCAVIVRNPRTDEERVYVGLSREEAVIAAHAQSLGDWNTWDYAKKYHAWKSPHGWQCGDWYVSALVRVRGGRLRAEFANGTFDAPARGDDGLGGIQDAIQVLGGRKQLDRALRALREG